MQDTNDPQPQPGQAATATGPAKDAAMTCTTGLKVLKFMFENKVVSCYCSEWDYSMKTILGSKVFSLNRVWG